MYMKIAAALLAAATLAGCSNSHRLVLGTPSQSSTSTTTASSTRTSASTAASSSAAASPSNTTLPQAAFDDIRASGVQGSDSNLSDLVATACIFTAGSIDKTTQDVANQLAQGGRLSPDQAEVVVKTALKYSCPENASKYPQ